MPSWLDEYVGDLIEDKISMAPGKYRWDCQVAGDFPLQSRRIVWRIAIVELDGRCCFCSQADSQAHVRI